MTENVVLDSTPLNALDRCDRCGAQEIGMAPSPRVAQGGDVIDVDAKADRRRGERGAERRRRWRRMRSRGRRR